MNRTVSDIYPYNPGDAFCNEFNIKRGGRCRTKIENGLLRGVRFKDAFITVDDAQKLIPQFLFHECSDVTADLAAVIALIKYEVMA